MLNFLIRRTVFMFIALWAVTLISFFIINLPEGDYVTAYIAQLQATGSMVDAEEADNLRKFYGLDRPLYIQYFKWMNQIFLDQNLGFSFEYNMPVTEVISERLLLTIVLAIACVIFIWVIAIPFGIISAVKQYSVWDYLFTFLGFVGLANTAVDCGNDDKPASVEVISFSSKVWLLSMASETGVWFEGGGSSDSVCRIRRNRLWVDISIALPFLCISAEANYISLSYDKHFNQKQD